MTESAVTPAKPDVQARPAPWPKPEKPARNAKPVAIG
jgi:hypothetical protein